MSCQEHSRVADEPIISFSIGIDTWENHINAVVSDNLSALNNTLPKQFLKAIGDVWDKHLTEELSKTEKRNPRILKVAQENRSLRKAKEWLNTEYEMINNEINIRRGMIIAYEKVLEMMEET